MVYNLLFFSSKCSLFHNSNVFGSCIIHILYTGVLKFKKNNSGALAKTERFQTIKAPIPRAEPGNEELNLRILRFSQGEGRGGFWP